MTPLSYHWSNLSLIAFKTMQLLILVILQSFSVKSQNLLMGSGNLHLMSTCTSGRFLYFTNTLS